VLDRAAGLLGEDGLAAGVLEGRVRVAAGEICWAVRDLGTGWGGGGLGVATLNVDRLEMEDAPETEVTPATERAVTLSSAADELELALHANAASRLGPFVHPLAVPLEMVRFRPVAPLVRNMVMLNKPVSASDVGGCGCDSAPSPEMSIATWSESVVGVSRSSQLDKGRLPTSAFRGIWLRRVNNG